MKKNFHNKNKDKTTASLGEPATQESSNKHTSSPDDYLSNRLQEIARKSSQEMTAFDLAFLFGSRFKLYKIHGTLHGFNGKYFYPLNREGLEAIILQVLFKELNERGDMRIVGSLIQIIERTYLSNIGYEESSDWLGFANGVLNI